MNKKTPLKNKTLIIGSGRLGASIANKSSDQGKNVMIIDKDKNGFDRLSDTFAGYTFIGDATDVSVLVKANIETANEIIIATGDDNSNLLIAHIARKIFDVPNIFVRLEDPDSEKLIKGLKINSIFPFELSLNEFEHLRGGNKQ